MGRHVPATAAILAPPRTGGLRGQCLNESLMSLTWIAFLAVWALCAASSPAAATGMTYYVAMMGNDANDGTEAQPFRTLLKGVAVLRPGDTLLVENGTYTADWRYGLPAGGTSWQNPVTIKNYPGHTPVIKAEKGKHAVLFVGTQYVILDGFVIDASGGIDGVKVTYGTDYYEANHIRIQNNEIMHAPRQGIMWCGDYGEVLNNKIHDNGVTDHDHGIYCAKRKVLIEKNDIYNNSGYGIHIYNKDASTAFDNIIRENRVHDNARYGHRGAGMIVGGGTGHIVYNNLVWNNAGGIQIAYGGAGNIKIFNNTIYDNNRNDGTFGISIKDASRISIENNIIFKQNDAIRDIAGNIDLIVHDNLITDPDFANNNPGTALDFKLRRSSPAIDAGATLPEVATDFDGVSRPQGCCYDIGAYEHP